MAPNASGAHSLTQQTISSFFSKKRGNETIDLTSDASDEEQPSKRAKSGGLTSPFFNRTKQKSPKEGSSTEIRGTRRNADQWRFTGSASSQQTGSGRVELDSGKRAAPRSGFRAKLYRRDLEHARITKDQANNGEDPDREDEDGESHPSAKKQMPWDKKAAKQRKGKKKPVIGPQGKECTPLEELVIEFKKKYPDMVLLIEVGYKYCFYGDDAKVAGEVLGFLYSLDRNFLRTSCPANNLNANIKKSVIYTIGFLPI
ncbi:hypothetical protein M422DRAFT_259806 [Sphaerobolus stellatus SS14]|uniref:DNA mismatch repair protein MutS-like N-terminal domain-containing protein n=1 Tax=Sphaerobolus stellatus (strain SS14) TaxID=990650 RepID=A0A0C9VJA4_SPHS4|nr:hypothetical protein M422DRAFT_259806 [Sphaerobolus stellatus SS14]